MSYFKFTTSEAIAAWDDMQAKDAALRDAGKKFASLFNGRAVFSNDITRTAFYGVTFSAEACCEQSLWTIGTASTRYARWPKSKAPRGMAEQHRVLKEQWESQYPKGSVDRCEFYKSIGLDWGMLFLTGCQWFRHEDAIYIETGATPAPESGAVEILGSDFKAARQAAESAKAAE